MLILYLIIVGIADLAELDNFLTRYVIYYQSFAGLAYYYNIYVKFISYYRKDPGLGVTNRPSPSPALFITIVLHGLQHRGGVEVQVGG